MGPAMITIPPAILEDETKTWRLEFDLPHAHTGRGSTDFGGTPFLWIPATVRLEDQTHDIGGMAFECSEVAEFLAEMERMYERLEGAATLRQLEDLLSITLRATPPGRGSIVMGGRATWPNWAAINETQADPPAVGDFLQSDHWTVGTELAFDGLVTDQTFLKPFISAWRRLVRNWRQYANERATHENE